MRRISFRNIFNKKSHWKFIIKINKIIILEKKEKLSDIIIKNRF